MKRFSFVYPFTHLPSLCFRCTCGPRNRRPHRQPAWGAGVRRDVRLPHHLQSGVRRRWSRHEGGQRVRGEPCALHCCARCNLPVCSDNMEKTKATRLPSDTFELSYSLIFCLCWSEGEITTWSFIFVATVHSVCMLWNCLCHPEWFLFVEGLKIIIAFQYYRCPEPAFQTLTLPV